MRILTSHKAVGIFDLYLSDPKIWKSITVHDLEAVAISCILIAAKLEETLIPRIEDFLRKFHC